MWAGEGGGINKNSKGDKTFIAMLHRLPVSPMHTPHLLPGLTTYDLLVTGLINARWP